MTEFVSTGDTVLDCYAGGGWALGRISQIFGMESTGKTQLAMEMCASLQMKHQNSKILYLDCEQAFDDQYAEVIGLDLDRGIEFDNMNTVEDLDKKITEFIGTCNGNDKAAIVLDSLDTVITEDEQKTVIGSQGGYGAEKAKKFGMLLKRLVKPLSEIDTHFMIISQMRQNLKAGAFVENIVSGGNGPKFWASQRLQLFKEGMIKKTIGADTRNVGVTVKATFIKNKVGIPMQTHTMDILFNHGLDDTASCLAYLRAHEKLKELPPEIVLTKSKTIYANNADIINKLYELDQDEVVAHRRVIRDLTIKAYKEVDAAFSVKRLGKYV